ncbi:hypothetical protein IFM58399_03056 [Aspergillus lentulus]|uniref:uncharacterized protein n=1 Tax=Aspergillus lentulus TaxID=293939 RepID=UPI0013949FD5|nr:uncharacterized protein IFM58399_03056 [Aspergillus lentulus]GFF31953.1 hypothetical protein IFM58399_03056 [Aspergillus lentulus]
MATLLKWARHTFRRSPSLPIWLPTSGFDTVSPSKILDEERFDEFKKGQFYPVNIGDVFGAKYQIIGKLDSGLPPQYGSPVILKAIDM